MHRNASGSNGKIAGRIRKPPLHTRSGGRAVRQMFTADRRTDRPAAILHRGGSSGSFWGGASLGGGGLTYPIFKFLYGFRPLYFEIAEF